MSEEFKEIMAHIILIEITLKQEFKLNTNDINETLEDIRKYINELLEQGDIYGRNNKINNKYDKR